MGAKKLKHKHSYIEEKLISNKKYKTSIITEKEFYKYLELLHNAEKGFISLMKAHSKDDVERWSLNIKEIEQLDTFQEDNEFYCSVNTLIAPGKHSGKYVVKLNALFADLDYYNNPDFKDLTAEQMVGLLEQELDYPTPSFYIDSGRGIYIIWLLESTFATNKSKKFWQKIEDSIINLFKDFSIDTKVRDLARVLRLIGSKNSKVDRVVKIIESPLMIGRTFDNPLRYELSDFAEFFWGDKSLLEKVIPIANTKKTKSKRKNNTKKIKSETKKVTQIRNTYSLNSLRYMDLEKLVELRADRVEDGWREHLLFLYRLHLLYSNVESETALNMTLALNSKLGLPMEEKEVIAMTSNTEEASKVYHRLMKTFEERTNENITLRKHMEDSGAYLYKNTTIIDMLNIQPEEQMHLDIIISPKEKQRRKNIKSAIDYKNNKEYYQDYYKEYYQENKETVKQSYQDKLKSQGKLSRAEQNEIKRSQIKALMEQGLSQRQIAKEIGLSAGKVNKHIKAIKEEQ